MFPFISSGQVSTDLMIAKVIMLDQFTRSVYRGSPKAFAGDAEALRLANLLMVRPATTLSTEQRLPWAEDCTVTPGNRRTGYWRRGNAQRL
jgi:hypothetical protein